MTKFAFLIVTVVSLTASIVVLSRQASPLVGGERDPSGRTVNNSMATCSYHDIEVIARSPLPEPVKGAFVSAVGEGTSIAGIYSSGDDHYAGHLLNLSSGELVANPPGADTFAYPRVATVGNQTFVVWGERFFPGSYRPTELWYAVLDSAGGWSDARLLHRANLGFWWSENAGAITAHGETVVVVTGGDARVYEMRIGPAPVAANITTIAQVPSMLYSVTLADGEPVIAFVGVDPEGVLQQSRIAGAGALFVAWRERDDLWRHSIVPGSIPGQIQEPILLSEGGGRTLHAMWPASRGRTSRDVIEHAVSYDRGQSWDQLEAVDLPDGFYYARAVIDQCGTLHVAFRGSMPESRLGYTRREGDEWTEITYMRENAAGGLSFLRNTASSFDLTWISMLDLDRDWRSSRFEINTGRIHFTSSQE